jgi:lysophospholipase L1-like esterase
MGTLILLFLEFSVRLFVPEIQLPGTQRSIIQDSVFSDSPGLFPSSRGLSKGVLKSTDLSGFWKYSSVNDSLSILFLGDSVTMGIGTENDSTFPGLIHNSLSGFHILNPSLIGYSSRDYLNIVTDLIVEKENYHQIKSVFLFWCLNDIYDNHSIQNAPGFDSDNLFGSVMVLIRNNSKLYLFLKKHFTDRPAAYFRHDQQFYESNDPDFRSAVDQILSIKSLLEKREVDLKVILLPYEYQLRNSGNYTLSSPQDTLSMALKNNDISSFDLIPAIHEKNIVSEKLYQYGDGIHFSDKGHSIVAEILLQEFFQ